MEWFLFQLRNDPAGLPSSLTTVGCVVFKVQEKKSLSFTGKIVSTLMLAK
jgi:hypothetical protein